MIVIMSIYIPGLQNITKIILLPCIVQASSYILFYMFTYVQPYCCYRTEN